ncbi:MAG: hypothetical protein RDV41_01170, partial [Planctomycetota bacterium]|nr:hypothetical protein [Planctomycetota bacterium]
MEKDATLKEIGCVISNIENRDLRPFVSRDGGTTTICAPSV